MSGTGWCAGSGGPLVLVDEAAEDVASNDPSVRAGLHRLGERLLKPEPAGGWRTYSESTASRCRRETMRKWSRQSSRTVRTNRSAKAFARG